jgi:hypothetical protein
MDKRLMIKVREFIGMPPRAVTFIMIEQHTGATEEQLEAVLDKLAEMDQIQGINGWICGKPEPRIDVDKLSKDDIEWLTGTGYYGQ